MINTSDKQLNELGKYTITKFVNRLTDIGVSKPDRHAWILIGDMKYRGYSTRQILNVLMAFIRDPGFFRPNPSTSYTIIPFIEEHNLKEGKSVPPDAAAWWLGKKMMILPSPGDLNQKDHFYLEAEIKPNHHVMLVYLFDDQRNDVASIAYKVRKFPFDVDKWGFDNCFFFSIIDRILESGCSIVALPTSNITIKWDKDKIKKLVIDFTPSILEAFYGNVVA